MVCYTCRPLEASTEAILTSHISNVYGFSLTSVTCDGQTGPSAAEGIVRKLLDLDQ